MAGQKMKSVREDLLKQLAANGTEGAYFEDMVEDYIALWRVKAQLQKDIKSRGITYFDTSSAGIRVQKNNPSTKELAMINRQMLSLLRELGLGASSAFGTGTDDPL